MRQRIANNLKKALVIFAIHQIAAVMLFSHALPRGKQGLPMDAATVVLAVLTFPFYAVSSNSALQALPDTAYLVLYLASWLASGAFWAALVLFTVSFFRKHRHGSATSTI
jgi:hypothetical protein